MKKWLKKFEEFYKNKWYVRIMALVAVCAYGFIVMHPTIGIDDTPHDYYFEEGLAAIVGRWVMFLLNKMVHVADFAPLVTDLVGVLILLAAVTVWAVLFRSCFEDAGKGEAIPWYGYLFFAGVFLSCPLISEVFTYYLHNGIAIGYLSCGVSLCCFREGLARLEAQRGRKILPGWQATKAFLGTAVGMWIAMGCYESFMIVWLQGICLVLLTERFAGVRRRVFQALCIAGAVALLGMVLRSVMIHLVTAVFGLEYLKDEAVQRSIGEMASWILEPEAMSNLAMVLKRMFVMYGVFAYAYYPIKIFVIALVMIGVFSLWRVIRGKDIWALLLMVAGLAVPLLLAIIECKATFYRSAQFLPVVCGYGALLAVYIVHAITDSLKTYLQNKKTEAGQKTPWWCALAGKVAIWSKGLVIFVLGCILWNSCTDMNRWFYIDYMKYESAKDLTSKIAYELERNYDITKPVIFTGTYEVPKSIIEDAYVPIGSETYFKMKRITDMVDEHLLEKFYRTYGVWVAQTPALSVIDWARYAFDTDEEMVRFFAMHGYEIQPLLDTTLYPVAEQYSIGIPKFPENGSIVDMGDYIIVHL